MPSAVRCHKRVLLSLLRLVCACCLARGLVHTRVTTAEGLQNATNANARHIVIEDHLDFSSSEAMSISEDYRYADSAVAIYGETRSVVGRCYEPPVRPLTDNWIPGHCVLFFTNLGGFTANSVPREMLWMDRLHFVLGVANDTSSARRGLAQNKNPSFLYLTNVTFEELDGSPRESSAIVLYSSMVASDLRVLNFGPTSTTALWIPFGSDTIAYRGISLIDSTFAGIRLYAKPECHEGDAFYCWPASVYSCVDLRLQNCTFVNNTSSSGFEIEIEDPTDVYSGVSVKMGRRPSHGESAAQPYSPMPLESAPVDHFLSLDDFVFVQNKAEVEAALLPAPPYAAAPAQTPPWVSTMTPLPAPATLLTPSKRRHAPGSAPTGAIVGVLVGAVAAFILALIAVVLVRRKLRSSEAEAFEGGRTVGPLSTQADASPLAGNALSAAVTSSTRESLQPPSNKYFAHQPTTALFGDRVALERTIVTPEVDPTLTTSGHESMVAQCHRSDARQSRPDVALTQSWFSMELTSSSSFARPFREIIASESGSSGTRPRTVSREEKVQILERVLDDMRSKGLKLGLRWTVLSSKQRRVGGQGLVQFVRDEEREEDCAVKFFFHESTYQREAQLYARPAVRDMMAAVVHMEPAGGACPGLGTMPAWIVLERGSSLSDWAAAQKPHLLTSAQVLYQIMERLSALHALGLVHRDIKPANILFLYGAAAKAWTLIDFGSVVDTREARKATLSYSLPYAAPEVVHALERGDNAMRVHTSLDIWSIGVVVYELLMDTRLFPQGARDEAIRDQLAGRSRLPWERIAPAQRRVKLAKLGMLQKVVLSCLSRSPEARPTAQELLAALQDSFSGLDRFDSNELDSDSHELLVNARTGS